MQNVPNIVCYPHCGFPLPAPPVRHGCSWRGRGTAGPTCGFPRDWARDLEVSRLWQQPRTVPLHAKHSSERDDSRPSTARESFPMLRPPSDSTQWNPALCGVLLDSWLWWLLCIPPFLEMVSVYTHDPDPPFCLTFVPFLLPSRRLRMTLVSFCWTALNIYKYKYVLYNCPSLIAVKM